MKQRDQLNIMWCTATALSAEYSWLVRFAVNYVYYTNLPQHNAKGVKIFTIAQQPSTHKTNLFQINIATYSCAQACCIVYNGPQHSGVRVVYAYMHERESRSTQLYNDIAISIINIYHE